MFLVGDEASSIVSHRPLKNDNWPLASKVV